MVILGILLATVAAGIGIGVIAGDSSSASLSIFGQQVPGVHTQGEVFAAGALVALFFIGGLAMTVMTIGRGLRVRRELRELRDEHQESLTTLEMEKRQLQRELARARNSADDATGDVGPAAGAPADPTRGMPAYGAQARGDVRVAPRGERDSMSSFFDQQA